MKNLKSFTEFVNESKVDTEFDKLIAEGAMSKKGAHDLADVNMSDMIDNAEDKEWADYYNLICDTLGEAPNAVITVDSETHDDDPTSSKIYKFLESHGNFNKDIHQDCVQQLAFDPKMHVVRADDYGFVGFYFTAKSNF